MNTYVLANASEHTFYNVVEEIYVKFLVEVE